MFLLVHEIARIAVEVVGGAGVGIAYLLKNTVGDRVVGCRENFEYFLIFL